MKTKKNKEEKEDNIGKIFTGVLIGLLIASFLGYLIYEDLQNKQFADDFCISIGFNGSTDYGVSPYDDWTDRITAIECDSNNIFHAHEKFVCVKNDKWGNCINSKKEYYI